MSAEPHAPAHGATHGSSHGHDAHGHHGDHHGDSHAHGSRKSYMTGFLLSVVLTAIPFALVMTDAFADTRVTAGIVMAFALVQIVVHMVYFLHMNSKSENGWTLMALIFTLIVVVIALTGSLWVMYHMNQNMMPGMGAMAGAMSASGDVGGGM